MTSQRIFLRLNAPPARLSRPFAAGSLIEFLSSSFDGVPDTNPATDNTSVNLVHGSDTLLHISIRRGLNLIVFNTSRNGRWDPNPQTTPLANVFSGPGATIRVIATNTSYQISFDGSPVVHTYHKRINANATAISYLIQNDRRVFSNPLIVDVFDPRRSGLSGEAEDESADADTKPSDGESADADSKPSEGEPADADSKPSEGEPADVATKPTE